MQTSVSAHPALEITVAMEMSHHTSPRTAEDDPRIGHLLGREIGAPEEANVVLIGFPSDEGVRINGGRPGAAEGPAAIREQLYELTPDARRFDAFANLAAHTADLGDVKVTGEVERDQERLGEVLASHLKRGAVPVILGGGHETTYGHFLGYVRAERPAAILNVDAHADVRPRKGGRPHSGSSFRLALEHPSGLCRGYTVAGLLPHSTARAHLDLIEKSGGLYHWRDDLSEDRIDRLYTRLTEPCLASFDLDAVDQSAAPGVSAPAVDGLPVGLWLHAAEAAGRCPRVACFDLVELNPRFDVDDRTARLAALTVWRFLQGLTERFAGR